MTIFNCNIKENKGKRIYFVTFIKILVTINVLFFFHRNGDKRNIIIQI